MSAGQFLETKKISGGDFSDWITGTGAYLVPSGFAAYAFQPGASGATIDTGKWLIGPSGRNGTATTIADAYKSKWIDDSVDTGPIVFDYPVTSITLSAGTGLIYCIKNNENQY